MRAPRVAFAADTYAHSIDGGNRVPPRAITGNETPSGALTLGWRAPLDLKCLLYSQHDWSTALPKRLLPGALPALTIVGDRQMGLLMIRITSRTWWTILLILITSRTWWTILLILITSRTWWTIRLVRGRDACFLRGGLPFLNVAKNLLRKVAPK